MPQRSQRRSGRRATGMGARDRSTMPIVVPAPTAALPFDRGWRPVSGAQNFLAFALARPFRARLESPDGGMTPIRIAACVYIGRRSLDLAGDGKRPRYAVLLEPRRRGAPIPPAGQYNLVSDCVWLGRLAAVPIRQVPPKLHDRFGARAYFHVL